jgi:imidazolonepropionase-like amidohydrolase
MGDSAITAIVGARVFDGSEMIDGATVVADGDRIATISRSAEVPAGADVVAGHGSTLLPGLIDAHVHTDRDGLRAALQFGVTTILEMQGHWRSGQRADIAQSDDVADLRSAGFGVTAPGGHPTQAYPDRTYPGIGEPNDDGEIFTAPFAPDPVAAVAIVGNLVRTGSDYIKIMIEDGSVMGTPGIAVLDPDTITAAARAAHDHGKLAIAHALTAAAARTAVSAGVDGLAHLFVDRAVTTDDMRAIRESGVFVTPCLVVNASLLGRSDDAFGTDLRVAPRLGDTESARLRDTFSLYSQGKWDDVTSSVAALHTAGVDLLVGTDASPYSPGVVHGVCVHHELQLLVAAGLSPLDALRAATSVTADRFKLGDRGRIQPGRRADLLLVHGDPATRISDTLSIRQVWRRGRALWPHE